MKSKIDLSKVREKLQNLQKGSTGSSGADDFWKPTQPQTTVRLVPYKHNPDFPFLELFFHYTLGRGVLSPKSVGKRDPIFEFAMKLRQSGSKEDFELAKKLFPKLRVYAPVIVRGEEEKGVRFWGFSKTIYESLLALIADDDYGDISDIVNGTDLVVEYQTPEEAGNDFGKISARPKRNVSPLSEDSKQVEEWINNQKNIFDIYEVISNEDLEEKLKSWLSSSETNETADAEKPEVAVNTKPVTEAKVEAKTDSSTTSKSLDDFEKMFNN